MAATQWIAQDDCSGDADPVRPWRTARGGTVLQSRDAPVFAALVDQWQSAGRMVPGQADTEWAELVGRIPRLTGV
ncbi:hypothetical protein OG552_33795 [Streptomyces sp. NBC_01476]|uniref:hypothetical protein n=1 Tax=Streptomyces sp. NBC_01476 TaxID=2903881 RepID=UPI002E320A51|nr:hypothetical protein [Streptomyces sp. NBC_01476]